MSVSEDDELWWECDESNTDEVRWAELLVQDGVVSPNIFNTFLWLENCRDRIKSPSKVLSLLDSMEIDDQFDLSTCPPIPPSSSERDWRGVDALTSLSSCAMKANITSIHNDERWEPRLAINNPLEFFLLLVRKGYYPPPELLLAVAKAIDLYFMANGKLSLEDVFFEPPTTPKQGNYSKRSLKTFKGVSYLDFHDTLNCQPNPNTSNRNSIKVEELALNFLKNHIGEESNGLTEDDLESFLRGYRRWRHTQYAKADT